MTKEFLAVYATLLHGFHKPNINPQEVFKRQYRKDLVIKTNEILDYCKENNIKVHVTKQEGLPLVLYIKGEASFKKPIVGFCGPTNIEESTHNKLIGAIKAYSSLNATLISGNLGTSETAVHKTNPNSYTLLYDGSFENYKNAISEFPPNTSAKKEYFDYKNELLARLCDIVVMSEYKEKSRSNNIIKYAEMFNKQIIYLQKNEVFKLPPLKINLHSNAYKVYNTFTDFQMDFDVLLALTDFSEEELTTALFELQLKGVVKPAPMNRYIIVKE